MSKDVTLPQQSKSGHGWMRAAVYASSWCSYFSVRCSTRVEHSLGNMRTSRWRECAPPHPKPESWHEGTLTLLRCGRMLKPGLDFTFHGVPDNALIPFSIDLFQFTNLMHNWQNIIGFIKKQRLNWLGHVERMAEDNNVQKIKRWKPMSKRRIGRPKRRWEDDVLEDIKSMNVRNWKNVAQNRDRWKKVVEQARTLNRL